MPDPEIIVGEKINSPSVTNGRSPRAERRYFVKGTQEQIEAYAALEAYAPASHDLFGTGLLFIPRDSVTVTSVGVDLWDGVVIYDSARAAPPLDEKVVSFSTKGGTQHIIESDQITKYGGDAAPDPHGMIGATQDGIEGVDVTVPIFQFTERHTLSPDIVTDYYKLILYMLTGKTNQAAFRGFPALTVKFDGADGEKTGSGNWDMSFEFSVSAPLINASIGGITGINADGWDYLWVRSKTAEEGALLVQKPVGVYVAKLRQYKAFDFSLLGIGS